MASLDGHTADPHLPRAVEAGIPGGSSFVGSGEDGGRHGALGSPWISRLRPPPPPPPPPRPPRRARPLFRPTAAEAALPAGGRGGVSFWNAAADLGRGPPPPLAFSSRLLSRDAAASSSSHMLQQQRGGPEAERGKGRRRVVQEQKEERSDMVTCFGPFQVRPSGAPPLLVEGLGQQQEHLEWRLEGEKGGGSHRSCRPTAGGSPGLGRGNHGPFVRDGCFPLLRRVAQHGMVRGEAGEVAGRDGAEKGLEAEDERWRVSTPPGTGTGQRDAVNSNGWRLQEASLFRQRGALYMSPNIRFPSGMESDSAAGSSQVVKNNHWLHRHRWGENPKLLDYHSASSVWPIGNGSITRPQVSVSSAGPQGLVGEASRPKLRDQHIMTSAQGAAYRDTADDTAKTRTYYDTPDSNVVVQHEVVIKSSFCNIERIERARVMSSFSQSLALDKRVGMKRPSDPEAFGPSKSQKSRTED